MTRFALLTSVALLAVPTAAQTSPEPGIAQVPSQPKAPKPPRRSDTDPGASLELYGSFRVHANVASVDEDFEGGDGEWGLTDAYSRFGARARFDLGGTEVLGTLEFPLNIPELKVEDPSFFEDASVRIASVSATGDWGSVKVGQDWLPYYNAVGYPVDYFSTIYSGYSTYAFFREQQIAYTTPTWAGVTTTVARMKRTGDGPRGWHYTASWSGDALGGALTVALGREDMDNAVGDTQGVGVSYTRGPVYLGAKFENADGLGDIYNVFGQVTVGEVDLKTGVGLGDQFAGDSVHLGADWRWRDDVKLFAEVYSEELNYAVLRDDARSASDYLGAGGFAAEQNGVVAAVGMRFDVSVSGQ